ncbi:MAG: TonB-dependent receptor [Alphaproteobacteria bacterium]
MGIFYSNRLGGGLRGVSLAACIAGLAAGTAFAQTAEDDLAFLDEEPDAQSQTVRLAQAEPDAAPMADQTPTEAAAAEPAAVPTKGDDSLESIAVVATTAPQTEARPTQPSATPAARTLASRTTLDEVIVTAQKRTQNVQDVPLSITAIGEEDIKMKNMGDLNAMAIYVPNLKLLQTPTYSFVYIRGAGTGLNKGFEQSVATIVDGIYYARMGYMTGAQIDIVGFEVLRGPQGTLYGKNTVAGAMHLKTGDPDPEWAMDIQGLTDSYTDKIRVRGMIKGPIWGEDLSFRIAFGANVADGFVHNTTRGRNEANTDNKNIRAKIRYTGISNLDVIVTADMGMVKQNGQGAQLSFVMPEHEAFFKLYDPTTEANLFNHQSALDGEGYADRDVASGILKAVYEWGDFTVTSISGYSWSDEDIFTDADFSAAPVLAAQSDEEYTQFSQELRLTSPLDLDLFGGMDYDYIIGAYFFSNDIDATADIPFVIVDELTIDTVAATLPAALAGIVDTSVLNMLGDILGNGIGGISGNSAESIISYHKQKAWSVSGFTQFTFHLNQDLDLMFGARVDYEKKEAERELTLSNTGQLFPQLVPGLEQHYSKGERTETSLTPKVTVKYDFDEDIMFYALAAQGFKGGGFNANAVNPGEFEFEEETSYSFEGGFKSTWLGGAMTFNANYYYTRFKNMQQSIYNGQQFVVANAETATSHGLELEFALIPLPGLILTANYGTINTRFGTFTQGPCIAEPQGEDFPCDQSGTEFADAPRDSGTLAFIYDVQLGNTNLYLLTSGEIFRQGEVWFQADHDPKDFREAVNGLTMRLGLHNEENTWSFMVYGNNLLDEEWAVGTADVPIFEGTHFGGAVPQRWFEAEFRASF